MEETLAEAATPCGLSGRNTIVGVVSADGVLQRLPGTPGTPGSGTRQ